MTKLEKRAYRQALHDMKEEFEVVLILKDIPILDVPMGYTT